MGPARRAGLLLSSALVGPSKDHKLDLALEVAFKKLDDEITLPLFRPARS
jgi:hypothetical protein